LKPRLLILPASIRSHVLPSLYLADVLVESYEIIYAVTDTVLEDIVVQNGYKAVKNSTWRVGYNMERSFLGTQKQKATFWNLFKSYRNNDIYSLRQKELYALIDEIKPIMVIIDLFCCTDFWVLHPRASEFKLLFFNPMPSTYKIEDYPTVSEGQWGLASPKKHKHKVQLIDWLKHPKAALIGWAIQKQRENFQKIAPNYPIADDGTVTIIIDNVPELLLAPLAFEFSPQVRKKHQYYLGLCMRENRKDTELDAHFEKTWPTILSQKQPQTKLIYCSFGTFYQGADRQLLDFVQNLLEVVRDMENVMLVCSVNQYVIETVKAWQKQSPNVYFFKRVPQVEVLKNANLFITHGGFGSIKESIFCGVPMLVYPLDPHYDQNGNALKVEHHGLGLRGVFHREKAQTMKNKIKQLIDTPTYRENVERFARQCYVETYEVKQELENLVTHNAHEIECC
jgi:UDP-N-acetylglucosamine transferase subunit ALG13